MSIRILFVDDEPLLIEGLKRSLRPMRRQWDTAFATGGEEALALLAREAFDVIVTDMRMPGMDGAALLNEVTARYPGVLRMVLSGQSDLESLVKSAGVTHQYLTKPCAMEHLKDAVNRAVSLRDLLGSQPLKQLVSRMGSVPSAPPVYVELMDCLKSKDASIERAARIIQKDMGMTAKVLQLANSPFFGAAGRMISAADAVQCLGLENIRALLLTVHAFSEFRLSGAGSFSMQALWRHSLATAAMAERIMQTLPSADTGGARPDRRRRTAARCGPRVARREPPGCLRARACAGRGEANGGLASRAGGFQRHARRTGSVPHRALGPARADRRGGGLSPHALGLSPPGHSHADRIACCRQSRVLEPWRRCGIVQVRTRSGIPRRPWAGRTPGRLA